MKALRVGSLGMHAIQNMDGYSATNVNRGPGMRDEHYTGKSRGCQQGPLIFLSGLCPHSTFYKSQQEINYIVDFFGRPIQFDYRCRHT